MKALIPAASVLGVLTVVGLLTHLYVLIVLGVVVAIGMAALASSRTVQARVAESHGEDLPPEERTLLRPIKKAYSDMQELVDTNKDSSTVQVMGKEALGEASRILEQAAKSLALRAELRRLLRGKYEAEKDIERLTASSQAATSDVEREALESAASARKLELSHYTTIEENLTRIDAGVRQAEAALAEMRTRLHVGASGEKVAASGDDDLRESLSRLKALSLSYDEAQELLRDS